MAGEPLDHIPPGRSGVGAAPDAEADGAPRRLVAFATLAARGPRVPARVDRSIRQSIALSFARSAAVAGAPRTHRLRVGAWRRIAALLALAATISLVGLWSTRMVSVSDSGARAPHSLVASLGRAVALAQSAPSGSDTARSPMVDPPIRAILAAIVALPGRVEPPRLADGGRFLLYDVMLDSATPPAAWCADLEFPGAPVGIEGGDVPFDLPALYDPRATDGRRLILAAVAGDVAAHGMPQGAVPLRIASVGVRVAPDATPTEPIVRSVLAVGRDGVPIVVRLQLVPVEEPSP